MTPATRWAHLAVRSLLVSACCRIPFFTFLTFLVRLVRRQDAVFPDAGDFIHRFSLYSGLFTDAVASDLPAIYLWGIPVPRIRHGAGSTHAFDSVRLDMDFTEYLCHNTLHHQLATGPCPAHNQSFEIDRFLASRN